MTVDELLRKVPFFKPLLFGPEDNLLILMRLGGYLEALQGLRSIPAVAEHVNETEQRLLLNCGQIILGLQAKVCELQGLEEKTQKLEEDLKKANDLIAVLTEKNDQLMHLIL